MKLNNEQKQAVEYLGGPLLVIAGAGSGKTRVVIHKMRHLMDSGYDPKSILAMTFTNKAAREMSKRLKDMLGSKTGVKVQTFHTFGLMMLKRFDKRPFTLFDAQDSFELLSHLADGMGISDENLRTISHEISLAKNDLVSPERYESDHPLADQTRHLYDAYTKHMRTIRAYDFDDLLLEPYRLLADESVQDSMRRRFRYFFVDEYQDTNKVQYEILRRLAGPHGNFTVVGDDDQSIYTWRGARPENLHILKKDYPHLKVVSLEQNYRSQPKILHAANELIKKNPHVYEKALWSEVPIGEAPQIIRAQDDYDEVQMVLQDMMNQCLLNNRSYGEFAILYRSNHQIKLFEPLLRQYSIPYRVTGGPSFFAQAEIRDAMAYFRLMINNDDDTAFIRAVNRPARGIGPKTMEAIARYSANRNISLFAASSELGLLSTLKPDTANTLECFVRLIVESADGLNRGDIEQNLNDFFNTVNFEDELLAKANTPRQAEKKIKNILDFKNMLLKLTGDEKELSFIEAVQRLVLYDILESQEEERKTDVCQCMTLHAAKGLEFKEVYIVGMEEGILPHQNNLDDDLGIQEERRLAYVGFTRAERRLVISYTKVRKKFGEMQSTEPSRFIMEAGLGQEKESTDPSGQDRLAKMRALLSASAQSST